MINNKSILAIIPARGGSKGVRRKNLRMVQGKSLLAHTIEIAKQSKYIDKLIVSSEDDEIIQAAEAAGAEVPFVRPEELASDKASGVATILHALSMLPYYDYVIVLQVTSPLRQAVDIDDCLRYCLQHKAAACVSVCETTESPYWMFRMNSDKMLDSIMTTDIPMQRQDLPVTYIINGAIYIAMSDWLQTNKSFLSAKTIGYVMPVERSLDIDTELDFTILKYYLTLNEEIA